MQKRWLSKREIVRTIWVVQAIMLLCEAGWIIITRHLYPPSGSLQESLAPYLRLFGGSARFTFPIGVVAIVMDFMPSRTEGMASSTTHVWLPRAILIYALLWCIGAFVVTILAIFFSWH